MGPAKRAGDDEGDLGLEALADNGAGASLMMMPSSNAAAGRQAAVSQECDSDREGWQGRQGAAGSRERGGLRSRQRLNQWTVSESLNALLMHFVCVCVCAWLCCLSSVSLDSSVYLQTVCTLCGGQCLVSIEVTAAWNEAHEIHALVGIHTHVRTHKTHTHAHTKHTHTHALVGCRSSLGERVRGC